MAEPHEDHTIEYIPPWTSGAGCFGVFMVTTASGKRIREVSYIKAKEMLASGEYHFMNSRKNKDGELIITSFKPSQFRQALEWIKTHARR